MNAQDLRKLYQQKLSSPEFKALLETISYAEGTPGQSGYRTMFTGKKFSDLSRHPDVVNRSGPYASSAAGKYQFLTPTWNSVQNQLKLPDFGPQSQDMAALHLIRNRFGGGLAEVEQKIQKGDFKSIFDKLSPTWASLPTTSGTSYYGQPVKPLSTLQARYQDNLGKVTTTLASAPAQANPPSTSTNQTQAGTPNINVNIVADDDTLAKLGLKKPEQQANPLDPQSMAQQMLAEVVSGLFNNQQTYNPWNIDQQTV